MPLQSYGADPAAAIFTKIFIEACVPNMGRADLVRSWITGKRLLPITSEAALDVFVGPGERGGAWAIPSKEGNFAISIRGVTEACAIWAMAANSADVYELFKKLIDGVRRPGIEVTKIEDKIVSTPVGKARSVAYLVRKPDSPAGFVFTMLTAERSGGAFQASLQVAKSTGAAGN
jgi:hypothetical protein